MKIKKTGRKLKKFRINKPFSKQQVRTIKKISQMSGELKEYQLNNSTTSLTVAAPFQVIPNTLYSIPQGLQQDDRVGDQITVKNLRLRFFVRSVLPIHAFCRLIVYQSLEDLDPTFTGFDVTSLLPNIQTAQRKYKMLKQTTFRIEDENVHGKVLEYNFKNFPIKKINYEPGSTTVTSGGSIRGLLYTDCVVSSAIIVTSECRIQYYD